MALLTSIRDDLEQNIKGAYGASPDIINKFLFLLENDDKSYGKLTDTHFTSSIVVLDPLAKQILLLHHKKYNQWLPFGGHWNDKGNSQETIFQGAIRELFEEGFNEKQIDFSVLNNSLPIDLDIHKAANHTHYDLAFLVSISKEEKFTLSNEAKEIAWLNIESILDNRHNLFNQRLVHICEKIRSIYPNTDINPMINTKLKP